MPDRQTLTKIQRNQVLEILLKAGLEPTHFSWNEVRSEFEIKIVSKLKHRNDKHYFKFDYSSDYGHYGIYSPGAQILNVSCSPGDWEDQLNNVQQWAKILKKELESPDLWKELEKHQATFSLALPAKLNLLNDPIPVHEAEQIIKALNSLRREIKKQLKLSSEQNEFVSEKLGYLADAVKRQGRLDWVYTCIGVLATILVGLTLSPESASIFWQLAKSFLSRFIHMIGP